tara:strand:+ start:266 stop:484 length:219 start_codon:yes stop_codon:yes gene_type:complete
MGRAYADFSNFTNSQEERSRGGENTAGTRPSLNINAMGHRFDTELRCSLCGTTYKDHQIDPKRCPEEVELFE